MTMEDRGLKVGLVKAGPSEVELLEPLDEDGTVARFLDRRGPGLHHVCFEVEDVEKSMRYFEGRGATFLDPVPRPGAVGLVSFMPPSVADGVLVELAQTSGYTFPEPEPEAEAAEEAAPAPVITRPILRGAAGYTRASLANATTWGQTPAAVQPPAPAAPPEPALPASPVITTPIVKGPGGYTRPGLVGQGAAVEGWPSARPAGTPPPSSVNAASVAGDQPASEPSAASGTDDV
jgi:methylmalonyl-CoA/ethylmalonyl-CoA epimerase